MGIRYLIALAFLAVAQISTISATAQTANPAAAGSVELRLSTAGQSLSHADFVTIYVTITTNGATAAAARSANSMAAGALTQALIAHGIDRGAITMVPAPSRIGFIGNEASDPDAGPPPAALAAMMARKTAFSTLKIKFSDLALMGRVVEVLDNQNQAMNGAPLYSLNDERAAKNAAIADALAKARQDAEIYAASLGLRVERITSVSNYGDAATNLPTDPDFLARMLAGAQNSVVGDSNVTTHAQVWVNFVLVPR